ncbi:MAG: hypothetical protein ACREQY_04275, partial [Candidatus Binatia bacterium]
MQAFLDGAVPVPNVVARIDLGDVDSVRKEWLYWWPPGISALLTALMVAGCSAAMAFRILGLLASIAGVLGWVRWVAKFELSAPWRVGLAMALPWSTWAWGGLIEFSSETFVFALAPWALLLGSALGERFQADREGGLAKPGLLLGAVLGAGYALKYAFALVAAGVLVALAVGALAAKSRKQAIRAWLAVACVAAIPVLAISAVNYRLTRTFSLLDTGPKAGLSIEKLASLAGNLPFAIFDSGPAWGALAGAEQRVPADRAKPSHLVMALFGIPGTIAAALVLGKARVSRAPRLLLLALSGSYLIGFLWIWRGASVSTEVRHFLPLGFALLPASINGLQRLAATGKRVRAVVTGSVLAMYALPGFPGGAVLF